MKDEISAAVVFIAKIVRKSKRLNSQDVTVFSDKLAQVLVSRFRNHWYEDNPSKGQGYRCIRMSIGEPRDSALEKAAEASGLDYSFLNLPAEMTLWVDPREVTCRFGERGTCCTIATFTRTDSSSDEEIIDNNGNPDVRIPSPTILIEQSQQGDKLRNGSKVHRNNFRNDIYYSAQQYDQYPYYPSGPRQPPRWGNNGAVTVRS